MCCINIHLTVIYLLLQIACVNYCTLFLHTMRIKHCTTGCFMVLLIHRTHPKFNNEH